MNEGDNLNFLIIDKIEREEKNLTLFGRIYKNKLKIFSIIFLLFISFLFYFIFLSSPNLDFIKDKNGRFEISQGESISQIANDLKNYNIIVSTFSFKLIMKLYSKNDLAIAGIYKFESDDNMISIAKKISKGEYSIPPIKITIPEGSDNLEIISILEKSFREYNQKYDGVVNLNSFSSSSIEEKIKNKEGFLFPDTYLFLPNVTLEEVVNKLEYNFDKKINKELKSLKESNDVKFYTNKLDDLDIDEFFKDSDFNKKFTIKNQIGTTTISVKDLIVMASFLEGEANNEEDMKIVSGILWTRLKIGMHLQIDAATSTYKNKGLTKSPINNPGSVAIEAAINPIKTNYIYYITDNDLIMRYAKNYDEHLKNINKYLRKKK